MNLEYIYFEDDVAEKLMEAFRLYGSKTLRYRYEGINPWIIYGVASKKENLFFTRGFCKGNSQETEYIFFYGNFFGQINCNIKKESEMINGRRVYNIEKLEILEIKGNAGLDEIQAEEIIRFYEENDSLEFQQQICEKLNLKSSLLNNFNVIRQHEIMVKNKHKWENMNELLAEDYIFEPLTRTDELRFRDCIDKYSVDYKYFKNAHMDYYMTDSSHSFKIIRCAYIPDGMIKHCCEPDDHEFAVITPDTSGTVLVWNFNDFRSVNGEIPIPHEKLINMFRYYDRFRYLFTEMLKNQNNI